jgi:hypothetical protein
MKVYLYTPYTFYMFRLLMWPSSGRFITNDISMYLSLVMLLPEDGDMSG